MAIASQRAHSKRRLGEVPYEMLISGAQAIYGIKIMSFDEEFGYTILINSWWEFKSCLEKDECDCYPYDDGVILIGV